MFKLYVQMTESQIWYWSRFLVLLYAITHSHIFHVIALQIDPTSHKNWSSEAQRVVSQHRNHSKYVYIRLNMFSSACLPVKSLQIDIFHEKTRTP